jgi:dipeptidyl aminopeptidase/acylaminoacyl peptidase
MLRILCLLLAGLNARAAESPILQLTPGGHLAVINDIAFTPDGKFLVSASDDNRWGIRLYHFPSGELRTVLKGHENVVASLAFSPDGQRVVTGSLDHTLRLWQADSDQNDWVQITELPDYLRRKTKTLSVAIKAMQQPMSVLPGLDFGLARWRRGSLGDENTVIPAFRCGKVSGRRPRPGIRGGFFWGYYHAGCDTLWIPPLTQH